MLRCTLSFSLSIIGIGLSERNTCFPTTKIQRPPAGGIRKLESFVVSGTASFVQNNREHVEHTISG